MPLTVAVTTRTLFDLEGEHAAFLSGGEEAYRGALAERGSTCPAPGALYGLVEGLARINAGDLLHPEVSLVVVSRNAPATAMRVLDALRDRGIGADRAVMTGGRPPAPYVAALGVDLFLTRNGEDGAAAAALGVPTGILADGCPHVPFEGELRIALDGDSVLFDDASDVAFASGGYAAWAEHERLHRDLPMGDGPLRSLAVKLSALRGRARTAGATVRLALATSREGDARGRALRTLEGWGVVVDEAYFLGDIAKAAALAAFRPHLFLDDRISHVTGVAPGAPAALVPPTRAAA